MPAQAEEGNPMPAIVVRGKQELKWGLYDRKLKLPYEKKRFTPEIFEELYSDKAGLKGRTHNVIKRLLWEDYQLLKDDVFDIDLNLTGSEENPENKEDFFDFNLWLGQGLDTDAGKVEVREDLP